MRASCTDDTGHRADVTRRAGIIRHVVPRTVPCPRPGRPIVLLRCVTSLRAQYPCLRSDRLIGPTVFKSVRGSLSIPASTWTFSICAAMSAKIIPCISRGTAPDVWHGRSGAGCEKLLGVQVMAERAGVCYQRVHPTVTLDNRHEQTGDESGQRNNDARHHPCRRDRN